MGMASRPWNFAPEVGRGFYLRDLASFGVWKNRPFACVNISSDCQVMCVVVFRFLRKILYTVSQKSEPPKHIATATANLHRFKWNFTHSRVKTTSIFVIDVKFHKNPLFRLRDVQFFQTAVTNLSYGYNLLFADVICGDRCDVSACW